MSNELLEYLFIDKVRVERYFQQLSAPIRYDKVPVWKIALGLATASVESSQQCPGREFTLQEKIAIVLDSIRAQGLLSECRRELRVVEQPFTLETINARRVCIERHGIAVNLWISLASCLGTHVESADQSRKNALYLIEDYGQEENDFQRHSGYSSLYLLVNELSHFARCDQSSLEDLMQRDKARGEFARDPIGALASIGGIFGPERRITVIYRFRAFCTDTFTKSHTTIGYPLTIYAT